MIRRFSVIICFLTLWISACATQPVPPPKWQYETNAIEVHLKADAKLNFDEGLPHTLAICLYQLKDPNAFNQLSEDADGIYRLLDCGLFDAGVATAKRIIVHPGKDLLLKLDRAEGAKYVAVAAGYYILEKERMLRVFDIPVITEKKGFIKTTRISRPGLLKIDLTLGSSQIQ